MTSWLHGKRTSKRRIPAAAGGATLCKARKTVAPGNNDEKLQIPVVLAADIQSGHMVPQLVSDAVERLAKSAEIQATFFGQGVHNARTQVYATLCSWSEAPVANITLFADCGAVIVLLCLLLAGCRLVVCRVVASSFVDSLEFDFLTIVC